MKTTCNTCTRKLVMIASQRFFWFRLLREPLKLAMRAWVQICHIDLTGYEFTSPACRNCVRSCKNALKDHSTVFCKLNDIVNPLFDNILERIVGQQAIQDAAFLAHHRDHAELPEYPDRWTKI